LKKCSFKQRKYPYLFLGGGFGALRVDDIEAALAELKERGVRLIDEMPRHGAGGTKIAFIHPKATGGVLLELCQRD